MKKFKKVLLSLSIILFWANSTYATTGKYMAASDNADSGKLILLLIAIGLVTIVLFLGYKLDQSDAQEKRKEQITRKNKAKVEKPDYNTYTVNQENEYSEEDELEYEKEYKKLSEETAVMQTLYSNNDEKIEEPIEKVVEVQEEIIPEKTYKINADVSENLSEATMAIDTSAIKEMIDEEESILPTDTVKKYTRKKVEKVVEEKPKKAKATTKKTTESKAKKTTTKKTTTKKTTKKTAEEKPKNTKTATKKAAESKTKKTTTKKTTKSAAEEKPKKAKVATKKATETKAKTTKKTTEKK